MFTGVPGQGDEEPVSAGHVGESRGALQRELPVDSDVRQPSFLPSVLDAEHGGADRAKHVVPRRGPGGRARPEPAQHTQPDQPPTAGAGRW